MFHMAGIGVILILPSYKIANLVLLKTELTGIDISVLPRSVCQLISQEVELLVLDSDDDPPILH